MKKLLILLMFSGLILTACGSLNDENIWTQQRPPAEDAVNIAGLTLTQGVFTGTGSGGFYGDVSVAITVSDAGEITAVEVVYSNETPQFADRAFEHLISAVISAQSANVDVYTGSTMSSTAFLNAVRDAMVQSAGDSELVDGTSADADTDNHDENEVVEGDVFTGTGTGGFGGDITVAVTVDSSGRIVAVEVVEHSETPGFANPAFGELIPAVISAQSSDVDIIAEATYTSQAFIAAVQDALMQAGMVPIEGDIFTGTGTGGFGGDITVAVTIDSSGRIVAVEVVEHSETPGFANPAFGELIPAVISAQSSDVDIIAEATYTSQAFISAVQDALIQAGMVPIEGDIFIGTGTGGFGGDITVAVTIDSSGRIVAVEVVEHSETPGFANSAFGELIPAVISAQSSDVDIIAEATYTSQAFIAAVQDALMQADE